MAMMPVRRPGAELVLQRAFEVILQLREAVERLRERV
jgi:hypothetical protein